MKLTITISLSLLMVLSASVIAKDFKLPKNINSSLHKYCTDCHDEDVQKGDMRLDNMDGLKLEKRLELLNSIQEHVYLKQMPPEKKKKQPTETERKALVDWLEEELKSHQANQFTEKLSAAKYANYLNHEQLFSGEYKDLKGFSYDRKWVVSEYIFNEKMNILYGSKRINKNKISLKNSRNLNSINPFLLPKESGVRYYANKPYSGGQFLTMVGNSEKYANRLIADFERFGSKSSDPIVKLVADIAWTAEADHKKELARKELFLITYEYPIFKTLYKENDQSLLPPFVSVTGEMEITPGRKQEGNNRLIMHTKYVSLKMIINTLTRVWPQISDEKKDLIDSYEMTPERTAVKREIIKLCEEEWFYRGLDKKELLKYAAVLDATMALFRKTMMNTAYVNKFIVNKDMSKLLQKIKPYKTAILKHRKNGDTYRHVIKKCMVEWEEGLRQQRIKKGSAPVPNSKIEALIKALYIKILERQPRTEELISLVELFRSYENMQGKKAACKKIIQTVMINEEYVLRNEIGVGNADEHGRRMLSPRDASYAISYALTDSIPDQQLVEAAQSGRLNNKEDYKREILRLLKNRDQYYVVDYATERSKKFFHPNATNLPIRTIRFFREFLGYSNMLDIFKDIKRFGNRQYENASQYLVAEADMTIENILKNDKNVFAELLSTEKFYVYHSGNNESMTAAAAKHKKVYEYFKNINWRDFTLEDTLKHKDIIEEMKIHKFPIINKETVFAKIRRGDLLKSLKKSLGLIEKLYSKGQKSTIPFVITNGGVKSMIEVARFYNNHNLETWEYPTEQPAKLIKRKGLLTHPAWLIAHSQNTHTDPVLRGKWIREKLLAGTIPDVPVTVDAIVPDDPHRTLRDRFDSVVEDEYCWKCHNKMNPLGNPFEMYDDFGRYRMKEPLEYAENLIKKVNISHPSDLDDTRDIYKTLPVNTRGVLDGTGDKNLDGEVTDALDLIDRLAKSRKVRQSIIRHAFRYFLGRNEMLSDSKALIDAEEAYNKSGGSFDAVVVSLLTSDSFLYRKEIKE